MKYLLLLLLCLPGLVWAAPPVPAVMAVAGLQLTLNDEARQLIQQRADGLSRHQPSFRTRVELADASFPIIDRILQQEGVPVDFRYLALQESALQGDAQSNHGAVGYWQLKRETATELGLRVDEEIDERRHLAASTRAAARYLLRSQASTQNWLLALLSYLTGLGGVRPYQLPTDAGATQMPITADTHPYVLMFLAHKLVFEPACGLNPAPPLLLREFPAVAGQTLASQAATLATDPADLLRHNHWLLNPDQPIAAEGGPYTIVVPVKGAAQTAALAKQQAAGSAGQLITPPAPAASNAARVQINDLDALIALPGESAEDLAKRGNRRLSQFLRDNDMRAFDKVEAGRPYYLEKKREEAATDYHVLQPGEDVAAVSQKYGIQRHAIRRKNHLADNEELRPGRVLWLRHVRPREVAVEYRDPAEAVRLERRAAPRATPAPAPAPAAEVAAKPSRRRAPAAPRPAATPDTPTPVTAPAAGPTTAPAAAPAPSTPRRAADLPAPAPLPPSVPVADEPNPQPVVQAEAETPPATTAAPATAQPTPPAAAPEALPSEDRAAASAPADAAPTAPAAPTGTVAAPAVALPANGLHLVQARESVYSVARRYQLRPTDLLAWNSLPATASLRPGQTLRLSPPPAPQTPEPAAVVLPATHTVVSGETLYSIARRYGSTPAALQQLNGKATATVKVGEVLRISAP